MADGKDFPESQSTDSLANDQTEPAEGEKKRSALTRRDFLIKSNAGAVAVGVMAGTGISVMAQQKAATAAPAKPVSAPPVTAKPMTMRRVTLDIDGKKHDCDVDVRESLWETMNYQLGLSNSNLGCDRAQCGACTVLMDGKAVNGCGILSARAGRGQKILTVAGLSTGSGAKGLHPLQRAFWLDGGFQCGICTRGFIMTAYALLQANKNPSTDQIKDALSGNICRCGEYPKIINAVHKAAAEMRGEKVSYAAPLVVGEEPQATSGPVEGAVSKQFEFITPMTTIEQYDELAAELKTKAGIVGVAGSERTISPSWDPAKLDEAKVRQMLAETGHPVKP